MYFEDLSPHSYSVYDPEGQIVQFDEVLNIGWLEKGHEYTKGYVDEKILTKLKDLIGKVSFTQPETRYMGYHNCDFCTYTEQDRPSITWQGLDVILSRLVIWIPSPITSDLYYAFPDLMYHYIKDHNYRPPDEFLVALKQFSPDDNWRISKIERMLLAKHRAQINPEDSDD